MSSSGSHILKSASLLVVNVQTNPLLKAYGNLMPRVYPKMYFPYLFIVSELDPITTGCSTGCI